MRRLLVVCLHAVGVVYGQATFEVASIKPHPEPVNFSSDPSVRGSMVSGTAITLIDLIEDAYAIRRDQIAGAAGWIESSHWDISAKGPGDSPITKEQLRQMLQSLLADRFQLRIHRETKEMPVFALVVAKNGPRFKPNVEDDKPGYSVRGTAKGMHMEVSKGSMDQLARQLSTQAGRPVLDRTGLSGQYTFTLDWTQTTTAAPESDIPSVFTAVQEQIGLKLESTRGPIEMLVIDHAEKPSAN